MLKGCPTPFLSLSRWTRCKWKPPIETSVTIFTDSTPWFIATYNPHIPAAMVQRFHTPSEINQAGSRWNNLRDKFVRSLHRKNDPRGAETEPFITKKPFPYKSQMMWLSPFIKKRRTAASLNALAREVNLNFLEHYEKHKDVSQPSPGLSEPSNETNGDTTEPCEIPRKVPLIACKSNSPWDLLLVMTPSEENSDNNDSWTRNETSVPLVENNNTSFKNTNKREYQQCAKKRPPSDHQSNFPEKFYRKSMEKNEGLINSIGKVSASFDKLVEGMGTRNSVPVSRNGHEAFAQSSYVSGAVLTQAARGNRRENIECMVGMEVSYVKAKRRGERCGRIPSG
uniref:MADF domain-containing protein n=1 Tax=Timema poppense TaxID=170557 RepID=A0A7R9D0Q8_TIMPO|nr:unnamed protein product [Timema poppensis]